MAYETTVIAVGSQAHTFFAENMALTFGSKAPQELKDYCYILEETRLLGALRVGQQVLIGEQSWTITALGDVAEKNLAGLAHVTLVFDGAATASMAGAIHLSGPAEEPALKLGARVVFGHE